MPRSHEGLTFAIVLAAGAGTRVKGDIPKAFLEIGGTPIVSLSVRAVAGCDSIDELAVAVPEGWVERAIELVGDFKGPLHVVTGGETRQASTMAALEWLPDGAKRVVCHDAARPFASAELFSSVLEGLDGAEGVIPLLAVPDTVKRIEDGFIVATEPRDDLRLAQTPQAFVAEALRDAHARAAAAGLDLTDDAAVLEWAGYRVRAVDGDPANFKITTAEDLARAEWRLRGR